MRARIVSFGISRLPITLIWMVFCCADADSENTQHSRTKSCSARRVERRKLWLNWIGELTLSRSTGKICTPSLQKIRPTLRKMRLYVTEGASPNSALPLGGRNSIRRQPSTVHSHGQLPVLCRRLSSSIPAPFELSTAPIAARPCRERRFQQHFPLKGIRFLV